MTYKVHEKKRITNSSDVVGIISNILSLEDEIDKYKEHFYAIGLDSRSRIQYIELVSLGILTATIVHPRELYRRAIFTGVEAIIVVHNHPSGNVEPSEDDLIVTKRLVKAGEILGIKLLDHIIITSDDYSIIPK